MLLFFLFLLGVSIGSFLTVLVDRLSLGESFIKGRSHCDYCKRTIYWYDLIPILSYFLLSGKCRFCRKKLSFYYPGIEFITGSLFVLTWLVIPGSPIVLIFWLIVLTCLLVITCADFKYRIIPDEMLSVLLFTTVLYGLFQGSQWDWIDHLGAGFILSLFFLVLVLITKGKGMGLGDVKYAFFMGFFLGIKYAIIGFYVAFLTGALISSILMILGKKTMKSTVPFGPFLVGATLVAQWYGEPLWRIFMRIIGI